MVAVIGTYLNGYVKLDKEYLTDKPVKVMITFLEDVQTNDDNGFSHPLGPLDYAQTKIEEIPENEKKGLKLSDFSFLQSQKNLEDFKGSFSDAVIEERRAAI